MNAQLTEGNNLARGPSTRRWFSILAAILILALLAGLFYFGSTALAVSTISIRDDEVGGDCQSIGVWDAGSKTCTMNTDLAILGIDAIHIDDDRVTLDGAGHELSGNGSANGVSIEAHRDVTVRNLVVRQFSIGIYVRNSGRVTLTGDTLRDSAFGAYVSGTESVSNVLLRNTMTLNGYGIALVNGAQDTEVTSNTMSSNAYGITLGGSETTGTLIRGNVISSNSAYGISTNSTSFNSVYNNIFDANATHAFVSGGMGNVFNQAAPTGGNWWSGWTGPDANSDGFVDSPYVFTGGQDNLPFAEQYEWDEAAPVISNLTPTGVLHTGTTSFTASYADAEPSPGVDIASVALAINPAPYETFTCVATGSPAGTISCTWVHPDYARFDEGHYDYTISITDNQGNIGSGSGSFDISPYRIADAPGGQDCSLIGTWDAGTKTCTMTADLTVERIGAVTIASDGVTLDGNGHVILAAGPGESAVQIVNRTGATVRDLQEDGFWRGIYVDGSTACTISGVTTRDSTGVELVDSDGNLVTACSFIGSYWDDVLKLDHADSNHILDNVFTLDESYSAVHISGSSGNEITGNQITGTPVNGVRASMASNTEFKRNSFSGCDYALTMTSSSNNVIAGNTISGSSIVGLQLQTWSTYGSNNNQVYNNTFDANAIHATVDATSTGNVFNLAAPTGGNWWSGWTSPDANSDGFVDNPYVFTGGQDNLPLVTQGWDNTAPVITNVQPSGIIRQENPTFTASYVDPELSSGVDTASVGGSFTQDPWPNPGGTPGLNCTAAGSPSGTITCTMSNPYGLIVNGHYEFELHITDNQGNTGTGTGSLDYLAYHILDNSTGGDCTLIGTWNDSTNTCTLTGDITTDWAEAIHIEGSGITLDGAGHALIGTGPLADGVPQYGVYVPGQTGVTVKNLNISSFYNGIGLANTHGSSIIDNDLGDNMSGIDLSGSGENMIARNTANPVGNQGVKLDQGAGNTFIDNNFVATGPVGTGLRLMYTSGNRLLGNTLTGTSAGVQMNDATGNTFTGNIVQDSGTGVRFMSGSTDNMFQENMLRNNGFALVFHDVSGNRIWHNSFDNNTYQISGSGDNSFNGGEAIGGNWWSVYDEPGEGCFDADHNGFCDSPYDIETYLGNPSGYSDYEPWTVNQGWKPEYYWTWYDNASARNWVLLANPKSATQDIWYDLTVAGTGRSLPALTGYSPGQVPVGMALTPMYGGLIGGPVEVGCRANTEGLTSQRILWAGNSLEEVLGIDAEDLSSHFYWTWYDQQSPGFKNWVLVGNPDHGRDAYVEIRIAGTTRWSGTIPPGQNVTPTFAGSMGGPVEVLAWTDSRKVETAKVLASQRVLSNGDTAFNEVPGIPLENLSSNYIWTWYDMSSAGARDWVLIANPGIDHLGNPQGTVSATIKIADIPVLTRDIAPGTNITPTFSGWMGGPVEVIASGDVIATQRVVFGPSFEEVPGTLVGSLGGQYHWAWYDQQSPGMTNWVLVSNQSGHTISYTIKVTGNPVASGTLAAGASVTPTFPGVMGGPVEVIADGPVMASQRVLYNGYFNEVLGTALS